METGADLLCLLGLGTYRYHGVTAAMPVGWRALSALLHHRLAFIGAPGHRLGGGDALDRTRRRPACRVQRSAVMAHGSGVHTEAALQLLASPYGLRGFL